MRHRAFVSLAGAVLLALGATLPVQAVAPTTVNMFLCNGGQWDVKAQSEVTIFYGWGAKTRKQINQFLNRSTVKFKIDGTAIANPNSFWGEPFPTGSDWAVSWRYPFGKLGAGNMAKLTMQVTLSQSVFDGYYNYPAGPIHDPALKCKLY